LHALGVKQLLAGRYDDAAQSLVAAAREQPNNARYVSDVATVQLERARRGLRPDDLPRALASADRARRLDPSLREAWFNRALATTALSLTEQAKQAWTEYLARDSASPWAAEARTRLQELSKPTPAAAWAGIERQLQGPLDATLADEAVRAQMTEARNFVESDLLPAWAAAVERGQDSSRELNRIRLLADALARLSDDFLYKDTVAAIDRAEGRGAKALASLARGHRLYREASSVFAEDRFAAAVKPLEISRDELSAAGSSYSIRAELDLGAAAYYSGRAVEAGAVLESILKRARNAGYSYIAARVTWQQALGAFGQGRLGETRSLYEETLAAFERMGDKEQEAAAHNLLASLDLYLGDERRSWQHREAALSGLAIVRSPRLRYNLLLGAASAIGRDDTEAALAFQNAVVESAAASGRDAAVVESLTQRATFLMSLGRYNEAHASVGAARTALQKLTDSGFQQRMEVSILATESDVVRNENPALAVEKATRAISLVDQRRDRRRLAQLNLRLAKANIVWGRLKEAEIALAHGIRAFDEERSSLTDGRISTLDEAWQLLETSVHLSIKSGDYLRAFAMSERARMRTVAEAKGPTGTRSLGDVQGGLAPDQAIVALNQFDDELAVWVIRRDRFEVIRRPVTRRDAEKLVARQQEEIWHEAATPVASRDLYNEILRPTSAHLRGVSRLVVVPDATYDNVAFAALWDSSRSRFLIEDITLTMSPAIGATFGNLRTARAESEPLIVGGPGRNADAEARAVAAVYQGSSLLTGSAATSRRFFNDAPGRSLVHLAARTASNDAYPLLSHILLADDAGRRHSGAILGQDIAARSMSQTSLVVIDEIEASSTDRGEGTLSLARAFMAAGVPAVLGTLPGAGEAATRDLMIGFHRRMSAGMSASEALTDLQRNVLQSNGRRLGAWSALVMYGSDR
jgi:CHAT domain-containing protein